MTKTSYWCDTCGNGIEMNKDQVKAHLAQYHKIEKINGTQHALMFMDGPNGWYRQTYEVKLDEGVKLTKVVEGDRT